MKAPLVYLLALSAFVASCSKNDHNSAPKEKVLYQNNFDEDDGNWSLDDYDSITVSLSGGYYQIANHRYNYLWEELTNPVFDSLDNQIALEMSFSMQADTGADYGGGGLMWNCDTSDIAYFFDIYTDGYYEIFGYPDGQTYKQYATDDASNLIKPGGNNMLRITLTDNMLHFIINGTEIYQMAATGSGLDGPGIATEGQSAIKVDYFKAIQLK